MRGPDKLMVATHNRGKFREFRELLDPLGIVIEAYPGELEVVAETGATYAENAALKARELARAMGVYALGDDSGVEVDALGGEPGILSARYVSEDPWVNSREILLRLMEVPWERRTARMRAVLCLSNPKGEVRFFEGVVEGMILGWPRGRGGFGVDPIFSLNGKTSLAEMDAIKKHAISHRGQAVRQLLDYWKSRSNDALFGV